MKSLRRCFVFTFVVVGVVLCRGADIKLNESTALHLANRKEGGEMLSRRDEYIVLMSPFDRAARMNSDTPVSEEQLLKYLSHQALDWSAKEVKRFTALADSIGPVLTQLGLGFPAVINMVKTTSNEEGGAIVAYTRQNNIFFTRPMLQSMGDGLRKVFIHELFHVLSRQNPALREKLYAVIGFKKCNEIKLPEELAVRKLTNPDAPTNDNYIQVGYGDSTVNVIPIWYSKTHTYNPELGKTIFDYQMLELMAIRQDGDFWRPAYKNGQPWLLGVRDVSRFFEQIGNNTAYIIHPEEILAENFVLVIDRDDDIPTPRIPHEMRKFLVN